MATSRISPRLRDFNAQAIVDQEINYTIIGGRFSPAININLTSKDVILSVSEANGSHFMVSAGSFRQTGVGGYVARDKCGLCKTDILLQPLSGGDWAYSVGIEGFALRSTPVTVSLMIGSQAGRATAKVYRF